MATALSSPVVSRQHQGASASPTACYSLRSPSPQAVSAFGDARIARRPDFSRAMLNALRNWHRSHDERWLRCIRSLNAARKGAA